MKIVAKNAAKAEVPVRVTQISLYNNTPLIRVEGSFKPLQLSKKKVTGLLANLEVLKAFASGKYDDGIKQLEENPDLVIDLTV